MTYTTYLENKLNPDVEVNFKKYTVGLHQAIDKLLDHSEDQAARLMNYQIDLKEIDSALRQANYEGRDRLIQAILTKNQHRVKQAWDELYKWGRGPGKESFNAIYPVAREIYDYALHLGGYKKFSREDADKWTRQILASTTSNMEYIAKDIKDAIGGIEWHGSKIKITPNESFDQESQWEDSSTTADIHVGTGVNPPFFMYFKTSEGAFLDDVLDGGDRDFFESPSEESDYFALVQKLRNPGETSSLITVYTARPVEDRKVYQDARDIPPNLFVTTDIDRAEGIANDLTSKGGPRDVWKLRIQSKYLLNTLDTGRIKDYQVIGSGVVPIKNISLVRTGLH